MIDTSIIDVTDTIRVPLPAYACVVDSFGVAPDNAGVAVSLVVKLLYRTNPGTSWTAITTSPGTITSATAWTWISTINNGTLPAGGQLAILHTTVTTKPRNGYSLSVRYH